MDKALTNLTNILPHTMPMLQLQNQNSNNIPLEIKRLIAVRRRASAKWHHTWAPQVKITLNRATYQLKVKNKEEPAKSPYDNITSQNRFNNSTWKPIKHRNKPMQRTAVKQPFTFSGNWRIHPNGNINWHQSPELSKSSRFRYNDNKNDEGTTVKKSAVDYLYI